jgi:hypothetical protein
MIHPHRQKWPHTRKSVGEATFLPRLGAKIAHQRTKVRVSVYQMAAGSQRQLIGSALAGDGQLLDFVGAAGG